MTSEPRIVLCMKWGTKYGPEYVNRLYGMVRRHLSGEFLSPVFRPTYAGGGVPPGPARE